ncbi:hypothetical protein LINGRAHAP2_LOCUS23199 [Linum grandiflorum]
MMQRTRSEIPKQRTKRRRWQRRCEVPWSPAPSVGEICSRDKRLYEERAEDMVGDIRHCGGSSKSLRQSCICHERTHCCPQLPT